LFVDLPLGKHAWWKGIEGGIVSNRALIALLVILLVTLEGEKLAAQSNELKQAFQQATELLEQGR
jgi:hypothetical protein